MPDKTIIESLGCSLYKSNVKGKRKVKATGISDAAKNEKGSKAIKVKIVDTH